MAVIDSAYCRTLQGWGERGSRRRCHYLVTEVEKPRGRELGRIKAPLNRTKSCRGRL